MDIVLTEEQEMLKRSARAFLQQECSKDLVRAMETDQRGYPPQLWQRMAELGWLGWPFPSRYGGSGGDFFALALVVEELGYAAAPVPFFSSIVLGGLTMLEAGTSAQKRSFLPRVASGTFLLSLAYLEGEDNLDDGSIGATAEPQGDGFVLRGVKRFVLDAHVADCLLCVARTRAGRSASSGLSLFLVDPRHPAVQLRLMATTAGDKQCEVTLTDVVLGAEALVGRLHGAGRPLQRALLRATALKCAEMVGGAQAVLDLTVDYVKRRVQFGRPLGAFQAVQHHCADIYRDLQMSRMLTYQACWRLAEGIPAAAAIAAAKLKLSRAYPAITRLAHRVIGGVGFYTEYPLELYTRRALASAVSFGGPEDHARRLADLLWK
jgi:alkylation response protein AidB-like acyl-CoA dehydrogenase